MIYKNITFKAAPFSYDLTFDDRITLVGGDSGTGKTVLYEMLEDIRLTDEYKAIKLFNYKSDDFLEAIKQCRDTGLFKVTSRVDELLTEFSQGESEKVTALRNALSVPFYELERYSSYVTNNTCFATHQGVKGLEFPRVMVIMDDAQARGFLFSYEKLFGAKAQSDTDVKNKREGKDTSITRTARLFYVACTRAQKSLAVVAYTANVESVKNTALSNGWFSEDEIYIL